MNLRRSYLDIWQSDEGGKTSMVAVSEKGDGRECSDFIPGKVWAVATSVEVVRRAGWVHRGCKPGKVRRINYFEL